MKPAAYLDAAARGRAPDPQSMAIDIGVQSPCDKSKRGVVIIGYNRGIGTVAAHVSAHNAPARGTCRQSARCREQCRHICNHAEQIALVRWAAHVPARRVPQLDVELYHCKVNNLGMMIPTGGPSCVPCANALRAYGHIRAVWLFQKSGHAPRSLERHEGRRPWLGTDGLWIRWPIEDFYRATYHANDLGDLA